MDQAARAELEKLFTSSDPITVDARGIRGANEAREIERSGRAEEQWNDGH